MCDIRLVKLQELKPLSDAGMDSFVAWLFLVILRSWIVMPRAHGRYQV